MNKSQEREDRYQAFLDRMIDIAWRRVNQDLVDEQTVIAIAGILLGELGRKEALILLPDGDHYVDLDGNELLVFRTMSADEEQRLDAWTFRKLQWVELTPGEADQ